MNTRAVLIGACAGAALVTAIVLSSHKTAPVVTNPPVAAQPPIVAKPPIVAPAPIAIQMQPTSDGLIPRQCLQYKRRIINESRTWWGLDGFPATFAAQIEQESACKADAVSRVGAQGLAQFMPETAYWFSTEYMETPPEPLNPAWAIRGLVKYDKFLWDKVNAIDTCNRMAKSLSSYNGGLKWITRDEKLAAERGYDPMVWFGGVDLVNSGRSQANWKENRGYPKRILKKLEPEYAKSGYGRGSCNE